MSEPSTSLPQRANAPMSLALPDPEFGLSWRAIGPDDAAILHVLLQRIERADNPPYRTTLEEAHENFAEEWVDPHLNGIIGLDSGGAVRAYGVVTMPPGDSKLVRCYLEGGVDPDWRRRGIGSDVLEWQLGRARQLLAASGKDSAARIMVHVEEGMADSSSMLTERGFRRTRYYTEMRRNLDAPRPEALLAHHLHVVPWSAELDDQVRIAHNDAFLDHEGSTPHTPDTWVEGRTYFAPSWSFLVLDRTTDRAQVAGYLYSGRYEQDWEAVGGSEGYIDILGVRAPWRGQGVGTALVTRALAEFEKDGMQYAGLGVDAPDLTTDFGLFSKLEFEAFRRSIMYSIDI